MQINVARRGLAGLGIVELGERSERILLPHRVGEVQQVGGAVKTGDNLDRAGSDAKAELKSVDRILYALQELSIGDGPHVEDLFGAAGMFYQRAELSGFPVCLLKNELSFRCGRKRGECAEGCCARGEKRSAIPVHAIFPFTFSYGFS